MSNESTTKTISVAGLLCFVCSILVSIVVVNLRPQQETNAELDMKKNILRSAGIIEAGASADTINEEFSKVDTLIMNIETGEKTDEVNIEEYDQVVASKTPGQAVVIPADLDVGGLSTRSKYAKVYVKKDESGEVNTVILKHWGKGLWSTMYGFIALGPDANTIKGFAYYSQGETPGLGGEVDNPGWKDQWIGKKIYDEEGNVDIKVAKGTGSGEYEVDGLSGATITANGVTNSLKYWFGEHGYADILENIRNGGLQ